jgi:transcriptional regulator with XRE-family HTH domain
MVGSELRKARVAAGLTQEELADRSALHRTYVSMLEREIKSPSLAALFLLCKALGIAPSDFVARLERAGYKPKPPKKRG